jgi:hypothetical protein
VSVNDTLTRLGQHFVDLQVGERGDERGYEEQEEQEGQEEGQEGKK